MAKGKEKMEEDIVLAEEKAVDFGELELKMVKPSLNSDKTISVSGNFEALGNKIRQLVDRYKDEVLTEDNVSYIKSLKGQFVSLRTGIERERKEYKKIYLDPAVKYLNAMCDELQKIIAEGENALATQLEVYDQKRKDELTVVLKEYVEEFSSKYGLREEYASQIQLIDKYYNKTQNEEDSVADIENQAKDLAKKQSEHDAGVKLIASECEDAGFLPDTYIRELDYKSAMEVILEIKQDKKSTEEAKQKAEEQGKLTLGEEVNQEIAKAVSIGENKNETRTRLLRITYEAENAERIAKAMKELCISFEFVKSDF